MELWEKTLESTTLYQGKILTLRRDRVALPSGREALREVVDHPGGVCILPVDKQGRLLFVRQYRYAYGQPLLELPAGKLEPGEEPYPAALRELEEETGHTAALLHPLGKVYPTPGCMNEVLHLYYADTLTETAQHLDEDEFLNVEPIPLEQAVRMALDGEIPDGKSQIALLKYTLLRQRGQR